MYYLEATTANCCMVGVGTVYNDCIIYCTVRAPKSTHNVCEDFFSTVPCQKNCKETKLWTI